ncbi:MAG: efflux RND transporter permease subunit [Myxococcales bacterium]|nr:efflux RND transporter permease subunit [Myxococcales bacterium]
MSIAGLSVRRPVLVSMATLIAVLLGAVAFFRLPVDLMPDVSYPTLSVSSTYENASPEEIEQLLTRPLEEALNAVPGVQEVSSVSVEGSSQIRVTFAWGVDLEAAANDIRDRMDRVIGKLPEQATRPTLRKFDPASQPILILGVSSEIPMMQAKRIIEDQVKQRIERVPGVASLDILGGDEREIHVDIYTGKMRSLGLSLDQLLQRLKAENFNSPAGPVERGNIEVNIRTVGQFQKIEELRNTVVFVRDGAPIYLKTIARVSDTRKKRAQIVRVNGKPGIRLAIQKQAGTNTVEVAKRVLKELELINRDVTALTIVPIIDNSKYIQRSIDNIGESVILGGVLAILVILFFLRNFGSTVVIALSIPISIVCTFALVYFAGFTLNLMTLGGLALGVGMLVDNSIVVLENIYRHREDGLTPREAAIRGGDELTAAIIASTLTTLVVFLPLIFARGVSGALFKQLAYVVAFALVCSLVVALTLVPMFAARLLSHDLNAPQDPNSWSVRLFALSEKLFTGLESFYGWALRKTLNSPSTLMGLIILALLASLLCMRGIGFELMPSADEGELRLSLKMEPGIRLGIMETKIKQIEAVVRKEIPELVNMETRVGGGGWRGGGNNSGEIRITLSSRTKRKRSSDQVAAALFRKVRNIPGMTVRVRVSKGMFMLKRAMSGGDEKIQLEIQGFDLKQSAALARKIQDVAEEIPGVTDAQLSQSAEATNPEQFLQIDRQRAGEMNLSVTQIANLLQTVFTGSIVGYYREGGKEYPIRVQFRNATKLSQDEIETLTLTNSANQVIQLGSILRTESRRGPGRIERRAQQRIVTLAVNVVGRDISSVVEDLRLAINNIPKPTGVYVAFTGDLEEQRAAFLELVFSILLSLLLVYMVMASLYENFADPFIVMGSVPLAAIGVLVTLYFTGTTLNMQSMIGCMMLGGIVVNNAILLVDTNNQLRIEQPLLPLSDVVRESATRRLRPILMTSLTTILGLLPMAIGAGEGGEAQAPLARAVIGGLLSSTMITLFFIPSFYQIYYRNRPAPEPIDAGTPPTTSPTASPTA